MKKQDKLSNHPFMTFNTEYIIPIIEKTVPKTLEQIQETGEIRNKNNEYLENSDYYHYLVFQKASAIISGVERIENSLIFIRNFPNPRSYERKGIHQYMWIEYHFSFFVLNINSLLDMALILTNTVYQLDIKEKDCNLRHILRDSQVKNTCIEIALRELNIIVSKYKETRNLFVHRGEIPILRSITESEMLDLLKVYSTVLRNSKPIVSVETIDSVYKNESQKLAEKLNIDVKKLIVAIIYLFDTLLPKYKIQTKKM